VRHRFRFEPPVAARATLARRRLLDRLRARWAAPVVVVVAPAGFGKTTLLAAALHENAAAPVGVDCWLACGPDDATASALVEDLCHAIGADVIAIDGVGLAGAARAVTEAMWSYSPQQVALILDDVHHITAGSPAAEVLASVVATLPANGHLVFAGRTEPPVALARLEVEGSIVRVAEADLAFTADELAEFARARGVAVADVDASGGWPAVAELSASARSRVAMEYASQEVLAQLSPQQRHDLALLAHLGPFDDDEARAVLGARVDIDALMETVPLVSTVPTGERSLHALWRTFLAHEVNDAEVASARRRAARALLGQGRVSAAVRLLIDAAAWDDFTDAVASAVGAAHPPVARDVLDEWFRRLPEPVREQPIGQLLRALVAVEANPQGTQERLAYIAEAFRSEAHTTGELACLVQLGQLAWWSEDYEQMAELVSRVFELEAEGCEAAVAIACLGRALIFDLANDSRSVVTELDRIPPGSLNDVWQGVVSWLRSTSLMHLGEPEEALAAAEQALQYAGPLHRPLAEGARLQAQWFLGHVDDVVDALPSLVERMHEAGYRNYTTLTATQCSLALALQGDTEGAARYLAHAVTAAADPGMPLIDTDLSIARAALAVARGDETAAATELSQHLERHPAGTGHSAAPQQRSLALFYVLVPECREIWDRADLGPAFVVARDLARLVVAVHARRPLRRDAPPLPPAAVVRAHLPLAWVALLGVAAVAAGRDDGWRLLDGVWPRSRPNIVTLAERDDRELRRAARTVLTELPVPPETEFELCLLGPIDLRANGKTTTAAEWRRPRVRMLLAYLVLAGTVNRERAADELWPELDWDAQSRNLRVTLSYLLRVLEPHRSRRDPSFFVRTDGPNISFHAGDRLTIDLAVFDNLCASATDADRAGKPSLALELSLQAVDLWRNDPTELMVEPWAVAAIEQRRVRFANVATRAGELLLAHRDTGAAHALAERALRVDPWLEGAHRLIVAAHRANGDEHAARRALDRYRSAIADLGVATHEATRMVERLLETVPAGAS
jgi:DNA-binding SARP family transcriptional activator/tetratricopeptide (TPR) repeat protein